VGWFDQHCHLPVGPQARELVMEARQAGVVGMVTVGTSLEQSRLAAAVAAANDGVWATAGVHPHDADGGVEGIDELLADPWIVAVGECGLDYHYDHSPRPVQREVFATQIEMAHRHDLPLVIHSRSAWDDTFAVLDREGMPSRTVFHCFTGGPDEAVECLDRGAILSFSGIVTFPSADDVRAAASVCPVDRLLVETDAPFLTPVPHRGSPNRPALVPLVGAGVAAALGVETAVVEAATTATAIAFYRLGS
jgi:TatD DNase family protein